MIPDKIHIAFAEDHKSVRKGIIAFLERLGGITVDFEADNGKDFIKQLELARNLPDVIILDITMPELDGFDTIKITKKRWPDIKVLILTTRSEEHYIVRMIQNGADGYLLKSCDPQEIKQALTSIKASGYYYSNVVTCRLVNKIKNGEIRIPHITVNETEFLKFCPTNLSYSQIAEKMNTSVKAVEGYRDRLVEKLNITGKNSRVSLAVYALQFGFTNIDAIKAIEKGSTNFNKK